MTVFSAYGWSIYVLFYGKTIIWKKKVSCGDAANNFWKDQPCKQGRTKSLKKKENSFVHHKSFMKKEKKHFRSNDELKVRNGLWFKEAPAFWAAFNFPTLPTHCWSCSMCLLYVPVSYCLPDIYISQLQAQHFPEITSEDVMNHIKPPL